jgi:hypothetical protein
MHNFNDKNELINFAKKFVVTDRIGSLVRDVNYCCLKYKPFAPFPALLYCFSTIDLLGALYAGNDIEHNISAHSGRYMGKFMDYKKEQVDLLQQQFRHKIVHLAQPLGVIKYDSRSISWRYHHTTYSDHLIVMPEQGSVQVTPLRKISWDHVFHVSIPQLVEDIRISVESPTGYMAKLEREIELQENFDQAIEQIYDPA